MRIRYGVALSSEEVASLVRDFDVSVAAPSAEVASEDCVCHVAGMAPAVDEVLAFLQRRCAGNQPATATVEVEDVDGAPGAATVTKCESHVTTTVTIKFVNVRRTVTKCESPFTTTVTKCESHVTTTVTIKCKCEAHCHQM